MNTETLTDVVLRRSLEQGDQLAFRHLVDGDAAGAVETLTYSQLAQRTRAVGAAVQAAIQPGDRVLLVYATGLDFLVAFLGAQMGGAIPVPVYPPDPTRLERSLARLRGVVADCRPTMVLTTATIAELASSNGQRTSETTRANPGGHARDLTKSRGVRVARRRWELAVATRGGAAV